MTENFKIICGYCNPLVCQPPMFHALVFYYCYNKLPQNEWIKIIQMYYLTVLGEKPESPRTKNKNIGKPTFSVGSKRAPFLVFSSF